MLNLTCPDCGRDWSKKLPPFNRLLRADGTRCWSCIRRKNEGIDYINAQRIAQMKPLPLLSPEERYTKAEADREMLYGKEKEANAN